MTKHTRQNNKAACTKIIGSIAGFLSLFASTTSTYADALTLSELNFHIVKCFEATTSQPASTQSCDRLLSNRITSRKVAANAHYNRGVIHFNQQSFKNAASDFNAALYKNDELYQAHIALAEIAIKQHNYDKALNHYERVIAQQGMSKVLNKKREDLKAKLEFATRTEKM